MPSVAGYVKKAEEQKIPISQVILAEQSREQEQPREVLEEKMRQMLQVMQESAREGENPELRSHSGLTGGAASKVMERARQGESLCGPYFGKAVARALAVSECNACMGRIDSAGCFAHHYGGKGAIGRKSGHGIVYCCWYWHGHCF